MADAPQPIPFEIETGKSGGRGTKVVLNGRDITGTPGFVGLNVTVEVGQPTRLALYVDQPGRIVGEGIVEVVTPGMDPAAAVRALDPDQVRQRVNAATMTMSMADDATAVTLAAIAALLDEARQ